MKSEGTTFGSEMWVSDNNLAVHAAGKKNQYTTLVLRMADDTEAAARAMSDYLNRGYTQAKLKAFAETGLLQGTDQDQRDVPDLDRVPGGA